MIKNPNLQIFGPAAIFLTLATFGWGTNAVASRLAVDEVSPMMLIFFRWGFLSCFIFSFVRIEMLAAWPQVQARLVWFFLMGGCGLSFFNALFYQAAHTTSAINIGLMQGTMPGFIVLGSLIFFGVQVSKLKIFGLFLSFLGVMIIVFQGSLENLLSFSFNRGDILMLVACIFYSGFALGLKTRPDLSDVVMMGYFSVAAFITSIPLLAFESFTSTLIMPTAVGWQIIFYIAIIPSFISQIFFMRGVKLIGPNAAGLYTNLVPIFAAFLAILFLNEIFTVHHFIAIVLVFAGIGIFEYKKGGRIA